MHLLAAQSGVIDDGGEAVDLGQEPGDIVVISAADSELAALARAHDGLGADAPSLRLANFMALGHNLSVDVYIERTVRHARLVVLRLLGGATYWAYGLEQLAQCARDNAIKLAVLPGDSEPDPALARHSTLDGETCEALHRYLVEGGPENARHALAFCRTLLEGGDPPPAARPLLKAGLYWPGLETPSLDDLKAHWSAGAPVAAVTFYRALIEGGNLAPVDELIGALSRAGVNALPIFVSSLKDPVSAATIAEQFRQARPRRRHQRDRVRGLRLWSGGKGKPVVGDGLSGSPGGLRRIRARGLAGRCPGTLRPAISR